MLPTSHPSGTGPSSESTKTGGEGVEDGWGMQGKEVAPAALAFTGSKSTNHARNIARASRSSARAVRRFCSILSSSAPSTPRSRVARRGWNGKLNLSDIGALEAVESACTSRCCQLILHDLRRIDEQIAMIEIESRDR